MAYKDGKYFRDNMTVFNEDQIQTFSLQPGNSPILLHISMFMQTIKYFGSEEQIKKYYESSALLNMIGCYAQTELGHGSNVAGLETTATLDMKTDEFVINTPNIKAFKFWPGALGV